MVTWSIHTHTRSHDYTHGHMTHTHMVTWPTHTWSHDPHMVTWPTHTHMVTWFIRACCSDYTIAWQLELSTAAWVLTSWFRGTVCWWPISPPPCTPALNPWSTVARTMNSLQMWWWRYVRRHWSSPLFPGLLNVHWNLCTMADLHYRITWLLPRPSGGQLLLVLHTKCSYTLFL